jgi:hypothetical protein
MLAGLCAPLAAEADEIVTLTYQSAPLTGTYTTIVSGLPISDPFISGAFTGTVSGSVIYDQTLFSQAGYFAPISYNFTLTGSGGVNFGFVSAPGPCIDCIAIISSNGVITGAQVDLVNNATSEIFTPPMISFTVLTIGPQGDSASVSGRNCSNDQEYYEILFASPTYPGSTGVCSVQASSSMAGTWTETSTAAPEIDPATAGSALTLLVGLAAIMRGRRRVAA